MSNGFLTSQDNLHLQVLAQRFEDSSPDWRLTGYALPILIPDVTDLGWDQLDDLRRDKAIQQLRGVLNEIEQETMDVAVNGGDLERAVHRAAEKRLARVSGKLDTIGGLGRRTAIGFVVGTGAGVATMGLAGPVAALASSGLGSVAGAVLDGLVFVRNRRAKQWVAMLNRLRQ